MNQSVSIVIIGRNEKRGIEKCIGAAQAAAAQIGGAEIIYVDSASTDDTTAIVAALGVRVVALEAGWELSPSAGRYVGSRVASGEFILFLDADTLVYTDFLPVALRQFAENPNVGGVNGWLDDTDENGVWLKDVEPRTNVTTHVKWMRGACCFYRRAALAAAGSFHPFIKVEEEAELGLRLLKKGWQMQILPLPMACHTRCYHQQTTASVIAAFKRDITAKRLGEATSTIAYAFYAGNGLEFCWMRFKTTIVFFAWLSVLMSLLLLPASVHPTILFTVCLAAGLILIIGKKRSLTQTAAFVAAKIINLIDLLTGIHRIKVRNADLYPFDENHPRICR